MLKIIISPAKKMNVTDEFPCTPSTPIFQDKAEFLHEQLRNMSLEDLKKLWGCSDKLALQNYERLQSYAVKAAVTPALLAYEGIQYQHIAPAVFSDTQWDYANDHLRILSGFYGMLKPTDTVIPYRLEMQAKLKSEQGKDLYSFWGSLLYDQLICEQTTSIVNLASAEYSKTILPYIQSEQMHCVTCTFGELINGQVKVKGTQAKIARGEMVRWMASKNVTEFPELKDFNELGYTFSTEHSSVENYVFLV